MKGTPEYRVSPCESIPPLTGFTEVERLARFVHVRGLPPVAQRDPPLRFTVDPFDLNPDMLYPIIDATTGKRTRRLVKSSSAFLLRAVCSPKWSLIPRDTPQKLRLGRGGGYRHELSRRIACE